MPKFEKTVVGSCKLGFSNGLHDVDSLGNDSGHQFAVKYLEKITFDHSKVHSTSSAGWLCLGNVFPKRFSRLHSVADAVEYLHSGKSTGKMSTNFG
ncbi:hypothetical protein Goshw_005870 [Gossypium schwendimanii]|uniref:Uncharacterized protein n=1 Tax=Gossypium schwendimanii TaxID=34291 RepID=A0A7J9KQC8_GOSSC|nr:hypothetical protein [Gossypium schwendimanii]